MSFKSLTPVLFAERIEPCVELWEKRLGFMRVADVAEEDHLGFAMLSRDGIVVMYQTWSSAAQDIAPLADEVRAGRQFLFVEVADLSAIEEQLRGIDYLIPKRRTFYGMTEVIIRDPAGHVLLFAQREPAA